MHKYSQRLLRLFQNNPIEPRVLGYGYLLELALIYIVVNIHFLMGYSLKPLSLLIQFILFSLCFAGGMIAKGHSPWKVFYYSFLVVLSSVIFCVVSSLNYDVSFDGQTYHQLAVSLLKNGYNPFYDHCTHTNFYYISVEHYLKCSWILESFIYSIYPHIEYAKGINLIVLIASLCLCYEVLRLITQWKSALLKWFTALVVCLNPVVISQVFTFSNDGLISSFMVCFLSLVFLVLKEHRKSDIAVMLICLILLVNIKFTALFSVLILLYTAGIYLLQLKAYSQLKRLTLYTLGALLTATLFFSYNPCITNIKYHHHLLYPLYDKLGQSGIQHNTPGPLKGKPPIVKLNLSLSSKVSDSKDNTPLTPAWPWSHTINESKPRNGITRINGMGPFFPLALLISHIVFFVAWGFDREKLFPYMLCILGLWGSILINPESWFMRFIPQIWLLPVIGGMMGICQQKRLIQWMGWLVLLVLYFNLTLYTYHTAIFQTTANSRVERTIQSMRNKVVVYDNEFKFTSVVLRMKENHIANTPVTKDNDSLSKDYLTYPYANCHYSITSK